jgi:hypothetical protein
MQEIRIKLWRHDKDDWSIELHGRLHKHISSVTVDQLAEYALVAAQQELDQTGPRALRLVAVQRSVN